MCSIRTARRTQIAPTRITARAAMTGRSSGPHQRYCGKTWTGPDDEQHPDDPDIRGVEAVAPAGPHRVLHEQRPERREDEEVDPVQAPPVAVLGARRAQDERDAVAGQQRAGGPREDALALERHGRVDDRADADRHEDLRDRELELQHGLAQDLERDDHRRELQPRVAPVGQDHGDRPSSPAAAAGRSRRRGRGAGDGAGGRPGCAIAAAICGSPAMGRPCAVIAACPRPVMPPLLGTRASRPRTR